MIKGFVCGSFRPFHRGHEALIEYAKANCDKLLILVTTLPDEIIPYKYRLSWVLMTYLNDPKVDIVNELIDEPLLPYDELSTWWGHHVLEKYGHFDRVFSSENYGKIFAEAMGSENWVYDMSRSIVPISATEIRERPLSNWKYINNFAKDYFVKKIAIVGTESTGKTVMCRQLASYFRTEWCPEAGRDIVPASGELTRDHIKKIGEEHAKRILRYTRLANRILIVDTDINITKSYSKFVGFGIPKFDDWMEKANDMDLYIYLEPTAPYMDDGTRFNKDTRDKLDKSHREMYEAMGKKLIMVPFDTSLNYQSDAYEKRLLQVVKIVKEFISRY